MTQPSDRTGDYLWAERHCRMHNARGSDALIAPTLAGRHLDASNLDRWRPDLWRPDTWSVATSSAGHGRSLTGPSFRERRVGCSQSWLRAEGEVNWVGPTRG